MKIFKMCGCLRNHGLSWKVAGSITHEVIRFFNTPDSSNSTIALGGLSLLQKWVPEISLGVKGGWMALKADNVNAICEPIV
jgi:hypothetical protein